VSWLCTDRAAPVYSFAPGAIAIIRTDLMYPPDLRGNQPAPNNEAVRQEFEALRARYPHVAGDAAIVAPSYWISWTRDLSALRPGGRCPIPIGFDVRSEPTLGELAPSKR